MLQEIFTYLIVALAVGLAVYKSYKKLKRKRRFKSLSKNSNSPETLPGCHDCVADCILRNASPKVKNENAQLCEKIVEKLKCS